ncbi:hypothetical protein [uncultured Nevskia sp.]|uniref:hypothetical protein n=1 Tax=uncultured Nevskia sp. TaxID=228950 RepID=UPI0025D1A050|nr:hypothetical protein [uncultured Nevskia sp.]
MRIGVNAQLPLAIKLPVNGLPMSAAPDRSTLIQVAALAAGMPWTVLDDLVAAPDPHAAPLPSPAALLVASTPPPLVAASTSAALGQTQLPGQPSLVATTLSLVDRLSLSPATVALRSDPLLPKASATVEFTLNLLAGLTGEPRSRLLLVPDTRMPSDPTAIASLATKGPNELLQLLVRGSVHSADGQLLDLTLGLSVQRQAGAPVIDRAVLALIQASLEELARSEIKLDYPGASSALAGHSTRFQAVLDPLALWPMQSFLLSGLLILGPARERDEVDEVSEEGAAESSQDHGAPDEQAEQAPAPPQEAKPPTELTPLPADGGPPIISASHWLELELRHWRSQLRLWMALPAEHGLAPSSP